MPQGDIVQLRYTVEHQIIPSLLASENSEKVIMAILLQKGKFFLDIYNFLCKEKNLSCPYREEDFKLKPQLIRGKNKESDIAVLAIDMPEPEIPPQCLRIYICHDEQFKNIQYYTLEKSLLEEYMMCGWDGDSVHKNYGPATNSERNGFLKVLNLYVNYLSKGIT